MKIDRNIRFGIIGCGKIAYRHAKEMSHVGELIAFCDCDEKKIKSFSKKFDGLSYLNVDRLLKENSSIDVIAVCTPNGFHSKHSISALDAGFHVLCEKPMALKSIDANNMILAAKKNNKHLFIVKQNRFNEAITIVKDLLNKSKLGKIYSFQLSCFWNRNDAYYKDEWHGTKKIDGGTLFTQFSHFIDILQWFFGDVNNVKSFFANEGHKNIIEFEDTGVVILTMQNGIIGTLNYTVNAYRQNMEGSLTIFGQKGTIKIGGHYLNTIEYQQIEDFIIDDNIKENNVNDYGFYTGSMSNHDKVYKNVVDVLKNAAPVSVNAYEGLKTVQIIEKIYAAGNCE